MTLQYNLVTGAPGPAFDAAVTAMIALGWATLGVPYVSAGILDQVFIKGSADSFVSSYLITAVVSGPAPGRSFTLAGNQVKYFNVGFRFTVSGSTGNDGIYTVVTAVYGANTVITVKEAVPSAVADGSIVAYAPYAS